MDLERRACLALCLQLSAKMLSSADFFWENSETETKKILESQRKTKAEREKWEPGSKDGRNKWVWYEKDNDK